MNPPSEIDLKEYGAMCEKINNIESRLDKFIDNEFKHLAGKVDKILYVLITALIGFAVNLIILLVK